MELYTLTSKFVPKESVDEFVSVIWTERYSAAGDVQLVVRAIPSMIEMLAPGTFLGLRGTKEIMLLETHSIENHLLTVTGSSLPIFLNQRWAWFKNEAYDDPDPEDDTKPIPVNPDAPLFADRVDNSTTAGQLISSVVNDMVINPVDFDSYWAAVNLQFGNDKIPGLQLGMVDANGTPKRLTFPKGPLYDGIKRLAEDEGVGFKMYLAAASNSGGPIFRFATYRGKDRTSDQSVHSRIRLTPKMDSLSEIKELSSVSNYKNTIYVVYKNQISIHFIPGLPEPSSFNRRAILVEAEDIYLEPDHIAGYRDQVARNTIAEHFYIQAVDGKVAPKLPWTFGVDYGLGDVIELEGYTGIFSKARVTEYIRAQDEYGPKEFPTLSVLDPKYIGYMPDLEPNPNWDDDWNDDTDFNLDDPNDPERTKHPKHPEGKHPNDPPDPNPDPQPSFAPPTPPETLDQFLVVGYYPDPNGGEAIAIITFDGVLQQAQVYVGEDSTLDPDDISAEIIPVGWMEDPKQAIAQSHESKAVSTPYPWNNGYVFWYMKGPSGIGGENLIRLTDTITENYGGVAWNPGDPPAWKWIPPGQLWVESADNLRWFATRRQVAPAEYAYADGTYQTAQDVQGHGVLISMASGGPQEVHRSTTGELADMNKILGPEDFDTAFSFQKSRWSNYDSIYPSPDGSKLSFIRYNMLPGTDWTLSNVLRNITGGTFKLLCGRWGNVVSDYVSTPDIPWDASAETIYQTAANYFIGRIRDPRTLGGEYAPPYQPWSNGNLATGSSVRMTFLNEGEQGAWMALDNTNLVTNAQYPGIGYAISSPGIGSDNKHPKLYICDADGSNVEEIDFGSDFPGFSNVGALWMPNSRNLHTLVNATDGAPYCRWMVYDTETAEYNFPLDYSDPGDRWGNGWGPLMMTPIISPNGQKIAYILNYPGEKARLYVADVDGTNREFVFQQTVDYDSTEQDALVLYRRLAWSFDSQKLAVVDSREQSPIWVFTVGSWAVQKVYGGTGWGTDEPQQIYDIIDFKG